MSGSKVKFLRSFFATDSAGKAYEVHLYQKYVFSPGGLNDADEWQPQVKMLKTSSGEQVNKVGEGRYELLTNMGVKIELTIEDPEAP